MAPRGHLPSRRDRQAAETRGRRTAETPAVSLREVSRDYGRVAAVRDVTLGIHAGECVVVLGHNGSGKSTTLRLAAGRLRPTTGSVRIHGRRADDPAQAGWCRSQLAMVGDAPAFYPDLTVREHVVLVALTHGVDGDLDERAGRLLADLALDDRADFLPSQLSGGMQQKLQLACALIRPFSVLLLDEPARALDPGARDRLWERLSTVRAGGATILLVTHYLDFPHRLVDRAVVLDRGRVAADGPLADVLDSPAAAELGLTAQPDG